jgi:endonuclease/exonuclease/phosphatase family metal-dependent hydrolase
MSRDPELLAESRALQQSVARFRTLRALHASPDWPALAERFAGFFAKLRRYDPPRAHPDGVVAEASPPRVRAVQWNIEHGNEYARVETALAEHPELRDADLLLFNEIDFGMARAANRDVTHDLASRLERHSVWAPLFLETTLGRDDDARAAAGRENQEAMFGIAILSRWPIRQVRVVELPGPEQVYFELERMVGRQIALIAEIARPGAAFVAVSAHLEVHRTRAHRADQVRVIVEALRGETRPVVFGGDWNTHTFDRGLWHSPVTGGSAVLLWPEGPLRRRLHWPDRGPFRERLFDELRRGGFEWERFGDYAPTLQLRLDRVDEAAWLRTHLGAVGRGMIARAERRGAMRLDWFAGRGWRGGSGRTVAGLDGPGRASDHAPIVAEFEG